MSNAISKPRILIVEDNPDDGELLMRQIKKAHLAEQVKVINDGRQAMNFLADANSPSKDLVAMFLDLKLPSLSGLDLLKKVRADERTRNLPVIVMTSLQFPGRLEEMSGAGCLELRAEARLLHGFHQGDWRIRFIIPASRG